MTKRRKLAFSALAVAVVALLALAFCPKPSLYGDTPFSAAVVDRDGTLLRLTLAADGRYRIRTSLEDVAPAAVDATLLYEDRHFRSHPGFNPLSLFRAAWSTYVSRERVMGASTITMQLARLRFSLDTRSIGGKLVQIARAIQLERHYGKDAILEAYLNLAPYGGNIEGIGAASRIYFEKAAADLSLPEALALAVIPQNPVRRDPSTTPGYEQMRAARARLFESWAVSHDADEALRAQFTMPLAVHGTGDLPFRAPQFVQELLAGDRAASGVVTSTLDLGKQTLIEDRIHSYTGRKRALGVRNASALLVDWRSMQVLASVGSADFFDDSIEGQVDGTTARRSPGSALKPFLYGLAIDAGLIHPASLLEDAPTRFAAYTPENFDRGFMGPIKARDALIYSRNVPAIRLLARLGHEQFHDFLAAARVGGLRDADYYGLAMILGGIEVSMQELTGLYAMLANSGDEKPLVTRLDAAPDSFERKLLSPEASFLVLDMLRSNPRPDAVNATTAGPHAPIAWKTGTSYAFRDAWTVGVFGPYVLAVWVGNFDGSENPAFVGRSAAAPLFFEIADSLLASEPGADDEVLPAPGLNLRKVDVCADTGDLPGPYCPRTVKSWFIPGVSPIRVSDVHRAIRVDRKTGLRACRFDPETTRLEVYEFWPSDILALFRKAGVSIRQPPRWSPECGIDLQRSAGTAPQITSPTAGLAYHVRLDRVDEERIPLEATTDGDASKLYWFVDDRFIAAAGRDEAVFWQPRAGRHTILAVDDFGRSESRPVSVVALP